MRFEDPWVSSEWKGAMLRWGLEHNLYSLTENQSALWHCSPRNRCGRDGEREVESEEVVD